MWKPPLLPRRIEKTPQISQRIDVDIGLRQFRHLQRSGRIKHPFRHKTTRAIGKPHTHSSQGADAFNYCEHFAVPRMPRIMHPNQPRQNWGSLALDLQAGGRPTALPPSDVNGSSVTSSGSCSCPPSSWSPSC